MADQMNISPAKLLIVVAVCTVLLVEVRTVLAFFGLGVGFRTVLVFGTIAIATLILWAVWPLIYQPDE